MQLSYEVKPFFPRNTTCRVAKWCLMKNGKPMSSIFGNSADARRMAAFYNLKEAMLKLNITLDMEDSDLISKIIAIK